MAENYFALLEHALLTLRMLTVKSDKSDWVRVPSEIFCVCSQNRTRPGIAILGADQKERGLWGREWINQN